MAASITRNGLQALRTRSRSSASLSSQRSAGPLAPPRLTIWPVVVSRRSVVAGAIERARTTPKLSEEPEPAPKPPNPATQLFSNIERIVQNTFNSQAPGQRGKDWKEVEGAWVLYPPEGRLPQAAVHFLGAAFLGAAPQLSYRLFLEALSNRDVLVVATPYHTNFDQLRVADETQYKFDRAIRALGPEAAALPVYGVGHSQGALIHLLIDTRYNVKRAGNAFLSYNNRTAAEVVPFLSPLIAPGTRLLGPLLSSIAASPARSTVESVLDTLRSISPSLLRQLAPVIEQLAPLYLDVSVGKQEFNPAPEESEHAIRTYYRVPRNLMLRFRDDTLDESTSLAALLQSSPAISGILDVAVRTLPGDHLRPLQQVVVDLPPDVARLANNVVYASGDALGRLASAAATVGVPAATAPLADLSRNVVNLAGVFGGETGGPLTDGMQSLADEVAAWMGTGAAVLSGGRALPAKSVFTDRPAFGATPLRATSPSPTL